MHVSYEKAPRSRKGKGGKVSGKRYGGNVEVAGGSDSPETVMILKPHRVSSNPRLAASESVKLVRGRRSLWKNGPAVAFLFVLFCSLVLSGLSPCSVNKPSAVMREPPPLAAAPATERSERVGEEAEESRLSDLSTCAPVSLSACDLTRPPGLTYRKLKN